jgi:hypothetical protein
MNRKSVNFALQEQTWQQREAGSIERESGRHMLPKLEVRIPRHPGLLLVRLLNAWQGDEAAMHHQHADEAKCTASY